MFPVQIITLKKNQINKDSPKNKFQCFYFFNIMKMKLNPNFRKLQFIIPCAWLYEIRGKLRVEKEGWGKDSFIVAKYFDE